MQPAPLFTPPAACRLPDARERIPCPFAHSHTRTRHRSRRLVLVLAAGAEAADGVLLLVHDATRPIPYVARHAVVHNSTSHHTTLTSQTQPRGLHT
jgi:hypothetical protein